MARRFRQCVVAVVVVAASFAAPGTTSADEFHPGERTQVFADPTTGRALVRFIGPDIDDWSLIGPDRVEIAHFNSEIRPSSYAIAPDGSFLVSGFLPNGAVAVYTRFGLDGTSSTVVTDAASGQFRWPDPRRSDLVELTHQAEPRWRSFDYLTGTLTSFGADLLRLPTATTDGRIISYDLAQGIVRFSADEGSSTDVVIDADLGSTANAVALGPTSSVFIASRNGGPIAFFVNEEGTVDRVRISYASGLGPLVVPTSRPDEIIVVERYSGPIDHYLVHRIRSDGRRSIVAVPTSSRSLRNAVAARVDDDNICVQAGEEWVVIEVPPLADSAPIEVLDTSRKPIAPIGGLTRGQLTAQVAVVSPYELTLPGAVSSDGASMLMTTTDATERWNAYDVASSTGTPLDSQEINRIFAAAWHEPSDSWIAIVSPGSVSALRRVVSIARDGTILWSRSSVIEPNSTVIAVSRGRSVDDVVVALQDTSLGQGVRVVNAFTGSSIEFEGWLSRVGMAGDATRGTHLVAVVDSEAETLEWVLAGGSGLERLAEGSIPRLPGLELRAEIVPQVAIDTVSGIGVIFWAEHRPSISEPWLRFAIVDLDDGSITTSFIGKSFLSTYRSMGVSAHDGLIQLGYSSGTVGTLVEFGADGQTVNSSVNFPLDNTFSRTMRVVPVHDGDFQGIVVSRFRSNVHWTVRGSEPIDLNPKGYWMLGADGSVYPFGDARSYGDLVGLGVVATDLEPTPRGDGYWVLREDGVVTPFGGAGWFSDPAQGNDLEPGEKATALSSTPFGDGYWVFTDKGNVLEYGKAGFFGDVGHLSLSGPIIDAVATPSGEGYYMVASDGGVFAFGDAPFLGSVPQVLPGVALNDQVIGLAPTPDRRGYWLVAADGGVFSFNAPFRGSLPAVLPAGTVLAAPVNGMVPYGDGYLLVGGDGGVFTFSDLPFQGSLGASPPDSPVIAIAPLD